MIARVPMASGKARPVWLAALLSLCQHVLRMAAESRIENARDSRLFLQPLSQCTGIFAMRFHPH